MLLSLRIRNLALVDQLEWQPESGFVAVTGETGAGKSIILGALNLILGERADRSLIRSGADQASVEAVFQMDAGDLNGWLEEKGLDPCEEDQLLLKRVIGRAGSGRQFVNGSAATLAVLKELGDRLVDLHGPHDHQSLFANRQQLLLLDAYSDAARDRDLFLERFRYWQELGRERAELAESESAAAREVDLLQFQVREIETAGLRPGEEEEITARYRTASNSQRLIELAVGVANASAEGEDSVLERLAVMQRSLRELVRLDPDMEASAQRLEAAAVELQDLGRQMRDYADGLEMDPEALRQLEERINLYESLKRKYGGSVEEVIAFGNEAAERLHKIENRGEELERLDKEIGKAWKKVREAGETVTRKRKTGAPRLAKAVSALLRELGFPKASFSVELRPLPEPASEGFESVEFVFTPNPGEEPQALKQIASSGEISRVMLALKSVLAEQDDVPLLVFDEIDANVGGEIAHAVGAAMGRLGKSHQVLCITHLPQVAGAAGHHYVVQKEVLEGRTLSRLSKVSGGERTREIARMLGGQSESALAHAETLLHGRGD